MITLVTSSPLSSDCRTKAVIAVSQPVGFCVDVVALLVVRDGEDIAGGERVGNSVQRTRDWLRNLDVVDYAGLR